MTRDVTLDPEQAYPPEPATETEPIGEAAPIPQSEADFLEVHLEDDRSRRVRGPDQQPDSSLHRHITHCSICNHPEREAIDQAILHWHSPTVIAYEFDLGDRRIVYRHGDALGLFGLRAEKSRHALGFLIEQAQSVVPSADAIIRAVRALSCIDDRGHWHEPRKEVVITHRYEDARSTGSREESHDAPPACTERSERARRGGRTNGGRSSPRRSQPTQTRRTDSVAGRFLRSVAGAFSPAPRDERRRGGPPPFLDTRAEKSSA